MIRIIPLHNIFFLITLIAEHHEMFSKFLVAAAVMRTAYGLQAVTASSISTAVAASSKGAMASSVGHAAAATASGAAAASGSDATGDLSSFLISVLMIVVLEIGDKTFLIAALMAMRHDRVLVFSAAFLLLVVMLVLLGVVGHAVPALLSRRITQAGAAVLFLVFGVRLLREGLAMSKSLGVEEELQEVEQEISGVEKNLPEDIEEGNASQTLQKSAGSLLTNLFSLVFSPVWIQVFIMTFLGEWGDRSQVATIAMAAGSDYWYVIMGAIVGHGMCTAAACLGGKLLAQKVSMRTVTLGGAVAFLVFLVMYAYSSYYDIE